MTPTSTSYTIPASVTGYTSNQSINPSELNIWRILYKTSDTIEIVSQNVSSKAITFYGEKGYNNLSSNLYELYSAYLNSSYCVRDISLIEESDLPTIANLTGLNTSQDFWLNYKETDNTMGSSGFIYYKIGYVRNGNIIKNQIYTNYRNNIQDEANVSAYIRPKLTLRSSITIASGSGTSSDPWILK